MLDSQKEILVLLNKYFKTAVVEKYPDAMIQIFMDRAWDAVCGPDYKKGKVSERDRARIKDRALKELRASYGKWISIVNFDKKFKFYTNFNLVYKTDLGRLYANPPNSGFGHLFFTSHSLEQFDERVPIDKLKDYQLVYRKHFGTDPTAADIILFFVMFSFQFGVRSRFVFLNVNYGILVMEKLSDECFIIKTFLSPDMVDDNVKWYALKDEYCSVHTKLKDVLQDVSKVADPIDKPIFDMPQFDYEFFNSVLSVRRI